MILGYFIHGLLYLYSLQVWMFANCNNFGCYRCCNEILVTFANFAKLADHKRSLFTFILLLNLLFLRHLLAFFFLTQSFHIARKSLVTVLRFLRNLRTSRSSSWPLFVSVEFCKICYSCYFCHICYAIFSHSEKKSCYFCDFREICGLLEALLGLLSLL